jgi:hypothetical protein
MCVQLKTAVWTVMHPRQIPSQPAQLFHCLSAFVQLVLIVCSGKVLCTAPHLRRGGSFCCPPIPALAVLRSQARLVPSGSETTSQIVCLVSKGKQVEAGG